MHKKNRWYIFGLLVRTVLSVTLTTSVLDATLTPRLLYQAHVHQGGKLYLSQVYSDPTVPLPRADLRMVPALDCLGRCSTLMKPALDFHHINTRQCPLWRSCQDG